MLSSCAGKIDMKKMLAFPLLKWSLLSLPVAVVTGSVVALFLWLLDKVTILRWNNSWLLFLLPFAGVLIHFLYKLSGKNAEAGNDLIIDEIHESGGGVPARMAPLVLITTLITHLFGGSAGREGTAVQIGGSIAAFIGKKLNLGNGDLRILLLAGIAAGFGAVFGTPVAAAIFALEVLFVGRINHEALLPCFLAGILADITCSAWGIHHTRYHISSFAEDSTGHVLLLAEVLASGICFGLIAWLFSKASHTVKYYSDRLITVKWLIPFTGGCLIIALTYIIGTRDYLGLGVTNAGGASIVSSFAYGGAGYLSWFWKLLFTVITLGMGFKGGEVTPLFFIGAALGNTIAVLTGAPTDLMAGLGFIAIFAGATKTPIACTIMGVELFGGQHILYYAVACFTAYYFSGRSGIYPAQRSLLKNRVC